MPRVISGKYRGAILMAPKGDKTRPTSDKVKEALFSMLQSEIPDSDILDLFAGSGQIGIEAVSRGAQEAVFVEQNAKSLQIIQANITKLHIEDETEIYRMEISKALRILGDAGKVFDIIFMDPPYSEAATYALKVMKLVSAYGLLKLDGRMVIEHASDTIIDQNVTNMTLSRRCKYGSTMLTFYKKIQ